MQNIKSAAWLALLTLLREWKATAALGIALYVAVALVSFLDRSMVWSYVRH